MKQLLDTVWQRRGTSWIWDEEARNQVCVASEVWSLRQFLQAAGHWPDGWPGPMQPRGYWRGTGPPECPPATTSGRRAARAQSRARGRALRSRGRSFEPAKAPRCESSRLSRGACVASAERSLPLFAVDSFGAFEPGHHQSAQRAAEEEKDDGCGDPPFAHGVSIFRRTG